MANEKHFSVLIVDDSIIMRHTLREMLSSFEEFEVTGEAGTTTEALSAIENSAYDIITLDIAMPGENGIKIIPALKAKLPEAKIVMVSSMTQKRMVFEALSKGADRYIMKPVTRETIRKSMESLLKVNLNNKLNP